MSEPIFTNSTAKQTSLAKWRTPWRGVAATFILNGILIGVWASRIPAIAQKHQLSEGTLGLLLLCVAGGAILSFPLAGRMSDQYGSANVSKTLSCIYGITLVLAALAPSPWLLAPALLLFGAVLGSMDVAMNAWGGEVERHIGRPVMTSFHAMWSLGAGLGAGSGYLAGKMDASPLVHFALAALISLVLALPFITCPWQSTLCPGETKTKKKKRAFLAIPKGALAFAGIIAFCSAMGEGGLGDWSAIFLVSAAGVDEGTAALGYTVFSIAMVLTRLSGDYIIAKNGPVLVARLSSLVAGFGASLAVIAPYPVTIFIGFAMMGLGYAVIFPLAFSRAANDDQLSAGAAIASVATFGYGGSLVGPVFIGFLAEFVTIRYAFVLLALLAFVSVTMASALAIPKTNDLSNDH